MNLVVADDASAAERAAAVAYLFGSLIQRLHELDAQQLAQLRSICATVYAELEAAAGCAPVVNGPLEQLELQQLEQACREIAEAMASRIPGVGYSVLLWAPGRTLYVSNVARAQMLAGLREFLEKANAPTCGTR